MKYFGKIGFLKNIESDSPGIHDEVIEEYPYYGEYIRASATVNYGGTINSNLTLGHDISIISDPFAIEQYSNIRYIIDGNHKWTVKSVRIEYPRLILSLGDAYVG